MPRLHKVVCEVMGGVGLVICAVRALFLWGVVLSELEWLEKSQDIFVPKVHLLRLVLYVHAAEGRDYGQARMWAKVWQKRLLNIFVRNVGMKAQSGVGSVPTAMNGTV